MTDKEILTTARALIDTPEKWCRRVLHEYDDERTIVRSCAVGAVDRASRYFYEPGSDEACTDFGRVFEVLSKHAGRFAPQFNDDPSTTHADILALFDRAIAEAA